MFNSISIVFPIYNEEKRVKKSLQEIEVFLNKKQIKKIEILLINDGSTDNTMELIKKFLHKTINKKKIKIISLKDNKGKGYALMKGVEFAKNDWILTADIDLSVKLKQLIIWKKKYMEKNLLVYFGSRSHKYSIIKKNIFRNILGIIFQIFIYFLFRLNITDTQCGFKLYKKHVAKKIFNNLLEKGYVHDVEIAYKCLKKKYAIKELPITWKHKSNGKVNVFIDPFKMLFALLRLKVKLGF